jgi:hypothetical protein
MLERWSEVPVEKSPNIEDKVLKYLQCWKDGLKSYVSPTIGKKVLKYQNCWRDGMNSY